MDIKKLQQIVMETVVPLGTSLITNLIVALLFWLIGRRLVALAIGLLDRALSARRIDDTVRRYLTSALNMVLTGALVVAIFGYLGVETTTFAALLAGVGLAVGTAWGDLLRNFAAGVFMLVLRPFKVGNYVVAGGIEGTVVEIGMFVTAIDTPDNVRTFVGNNAVFGGTIKNFSNNAHRRVELVAQLSSDADWKKVITELQTRLAKIPNVVANPAPDVYILTFSERGPVLCVRPHCHTDHYWQVYFDTNALIASVGADLNLPTPQIPVRLAGNA
jgi:small conductance mechanosensitive channel